METIFKKFKKMLSLDEDERFDQVKKLFFDLRSDIIKEEGDCDDNRLALMITKELDLGYDMYLALCASALIDDQGLNDII